MKRLVGIADSVEHRELPAFRQRFRVTAGAVIVCVIFAAVLILAFTSFQPPPLDAIETENMSTETSHPVQISSNTVLVHVVGQVTNPGIYELELGARVVDAVMAAGGSLGDLNTCEVNLAREIKDGERLVITTDNQDCTPETNSDTAAQLSLNSATSEQLEELPGIGPSLAEQIISWREQNGGFDDVNQLDEVPGIGPTILARLTALLTL